MCMGTLSPSPWLLLQIPSCAWPCLMASLDQQQAKQHTVATFYVELRTRPFSVPAGATGQVGARIARELLRAGFKVTAGDLPFLMPYGVASHEQDIKPS